MKETTKQGVSVSSSPGTSVRPKVAYLRQCVMHATYIGPLYQVTKATLKSVNLVNV